MLTLAGCYLLFEITDEVAEGAGLNLSIVAGHRDRRRGCGQGQEDGMTRARADPLGHIIKLGLVQTQSLGDLEIWFVILILHQLLHNRVVSLCQQQLGRKQ